MNERLTAQRRIVTEDDLARQGFSPEQIQALVFLRDRYPVIEFVNSRIGCERLVFLRWYYRAGRIAV
jgi:hypothetical protein